MRLTYHRVARGKEGHVLTLNVLDFPIEELELGVRAYNILKRHNVDTLAQLLDVTIEDANAWAMTEYANGSYRQHHALGFVPAMQVIDAQNYIRSLL